jgi:hypothetical protein
MAKPRQAGRTISDVDSDSRMPRAKPPRQAVFHPGKTVCKVVRKRTAFRSTFAVLSERLPGTSRLAGLRPTRIDAAPKAGTRTTGQNDSGPAPDDE